MNLTLFLVIFLDLLGFGIVIPILPYFAESTGASGWELGWLLTSYSLLQLIASPFWGGLSDRIGRKPVLLISILGNAGAMALLSQADTLLGLFCARILAGFFAANIGTAYAMVTDLTTDQNRTKAMGMMGASFALGFTFGPGLGALFAPYGFDVPILIAAFLGFGNFVLAIFKLKEPPRKKARTKLGLKGIQQVLSNRKSFIPIAHFFLFIFAVTQLESLFALFMGRYYGFDAQKMGALMCVMGLLVAMIQGGGAGRLAKKMGETRMAFAGIALCFIGVLSFSLTSTLAVGIAGLAVLAFGRGLLHPALSSLTSFSAPESMRGLTMGLFQSASSLARAVGPAIGGALYDFVGHRSPFYLAAAVLLFSLLWFRASSRT